MKRTTKNLPSRSKILNELSLLFSEMTLLWCLAWLYCNLSRFSSIRDKHKEGRFVSSSFASTHTEAKAKAKTTSHRILSIPLCNPVNRVIPVRTQPDNENIEV